MGRQQSLDIMKGITIVLMVIGHLTFFTDGHIFCQGLLWRATYSFHMPLFFILAGYFYSNKGTLRKDLCRLGIPYLLVTGLLWISCTVAQLADIQSVRYVSGGGILPVAFWGSGWYHSSKHFGNVPPYCVMWFLPAMFWCKTLFRGLETKIKDTTLLGFVCLCCALFAIYVVHPQIYLPLSFNEGVAAMVFYYIGYLVKKCGDIDFKWPLFGIAFVLAIVAFGHGTLGMDCCYYQSYIICLVGAVCGTTLMYGISKWLEKVKYVNIVLAWLGRASLLILCVHATMFIFCDLCKTISNPYAVLALCLGYAIIGAWLLSFIPIVKKIFKI